MKLATVAQASDMDRTAVEEYAIPETVLMENAGGAALHIIGEKTAIEGTGFLILCGPGNNGGDGLVLARLLYSRGGAPVVLMVSGPEKLKGPSLANYEILRNFPIEIIHQFSIERLKKEIEETDIVIDALLGTGLSREISGPFKAIIEEINSSQKPLFSLDIPSGISGDTGRIMGTAVNADHTISFGALKPGNLLFPGFLNNGSLSLSRISLPPEIYDSSELTISVNICENLPPRDENGHKKTFGDILTISGSGSYYGAPLLASSAVLKSGSGFSRLAVPSSMIPVLASGIPEAVFLPMEETDRSSISPSNLPVLLKQAALCDASVIGPGLSLNSRTAELICSFLRSAEGFIVVDGDALSAIAGKFHLFERKNLISVLTPHKGEMARLCARTPAEISENPLDYLRTYAEKYNSIIVLKGPHSLIGFPDGRIFLNLSGNSGLGTAGSGDILTGVIAGLYGTGLSGEEAVKTGVFLHGVAGDLAADQWGKDGLTARDILDKIPEAIRLFRVNENLPAELAGRIIREI